MFGMGKLELPMAELETDDWALLLLVDFDTVDGALGRLELVVEMSSYNRILWKAPQA